jgi:hypothetical protein
VTYTFVPVPVGIELSANEVRTSAEVVETAPRNAPVLVPAAGRASSAVPGAPTAGPRRPRPSTRRPRSAVPQRGRRPVEGVAGQGARRRRGDGHLLRGARRWRRRRRSPSASPCTCPVPPRRCAARWHRSPSRRRRRTRRTTRSTVGVHGAPAVDRHGGPAGGHGERGRRRLGWPVGAVTVTWREVVPVAPPSSVHGQRHGCRCRRRVGVRGGGAGAGRGAVTPVPGVRGDPAAGVGRAAAVDRHGQVARRRGERRGRRGVGRPAGVPRLWWLATWSADSTVG